MMPGSCDDDFLSADGAIGMTAHLADGSAAPKDRAEKRWCAAFFGRTAQLVAQTALAAAAVALMSSGLSVAQAQHEVSPQALGAARTARAGFLQADAGVSLAEQQWVLDSLSSQARLRMRGVSITSGVPAAPQSEDNQASEAPFAPDGLSLPYTRTQMQDGKATCYIFLHGVDRVLQLGLGKSRDALSQELEQRMRKIIVQHEAAHCEMDALEETPASKVPAPWAQKKSDLLMAPFTIDGGAAAGAASFSIFEEAMSLQAERYADAKALLIMVREKTSSLGYASPLAQIQAAARAAQEDVDAVKRIRRNETRMLGESGETGEFAPIVHDHNTSPVIEAIKSSVSKNPLAFLNASDFDLSQIAGALATGSLLSEQGSLMQSALSRSAAQLKVRISKESGALELAASDAQYLARQAKALAEMSARAASGTPDQQRTLQERADRAQRAVDALVNKENGSIPGKNDMENLEKAHEQVKKRMPSAAFALDSLDFMRLANAQGAALSERTQGLAAARSRLSFLEKCLAEQAWTSGAKWGASAAPYAQASQDAALQLAQGADASALVLLVSGKSALSLAGFSRALDASVQRAGKGALQLLTTLAAGDEPAGTPPAPERRPAGLRP